MTTALRVEELTLAGYPGIAVGEQGDKPPVVFLHGSFSDHDCFTTWPSVDFATSWPAVFAAHGYRSYVFSRRGRRGVPPENLDDLVFDDYAEDTNRVLDEIDGAPILVGHSLGGSLSLRMAESRQLAAAVITNSAQKGRPSFKALQTYLPRMHRVLGGRAFKISQKGLNRAVFNGIPTDQQSAVGNKLVPESGKVFRKSIFGSLGLDPAKITCPLLFASGGDDLIFPPRAVRLTAKDFDAEVKIFDGFGHLMPEEPGADKAAAEIAQWLDEHADKTAASRSTGQPADV